MGNQASSPAPPQLAPGPPPGQPFIHPLYSEEPILSPRKEGFGFYPVTLGATFEEDRYKVVRKLGWGLSSTVWLVRDQKNNSYAALKILTANMTRGFRLGRLGELPLMERVTAANPTHPGFQHIVTILDKFFVNSEHGEHVCLVTPFLGTHLGSLRAAQPGQHFELSTVKKISKQILLALDYLHRECGIVHTDLKPDNLMVDHSLSNEAIDDWIREVPSDTYAPLVIPEISPEPFTTIKSQPIDSSRLGNDVENISVRVADLGHSHWVDHHFDEYIQPIDLRAPEAFIGYPWSTPVDIWTVGCLVFEWLTRVSLFYPGPLTSPILREEDLHLARIMEITGQRFPSDMLELSVSDRAAVYFAVEEGSTHASPDRMRRVANIPPHYSIERCLRNYLALTDEEFKDTARFMGLCLIIDPRKRPTAAELLEDSWLQVA